ncbi:MAG: glycosyltransferase [bacterium]|nr:glycosyltransferase [bacterium]MDO5462967.1 glycosyltransferase [bacterium]
MLTIVLYKDVFKSGRGADRATAALLNALASRGYTLHLITQHRPTEPFSVTLAQNIHYHTLTIPPKKGIKAIVNKLFLRFKLGERLLRRWLPACDTTLQTCRRLQALIAPLVPDLILSAGSNETIDLCAEGNLPAPLLQLFHIFPLEAFKKNKLQRATRFKHALRNHVNACQVLLPSHVEALRPYTTAPIKAIGNAIAAPCNLQRPPTDQRDKHIVYIAYFSKDKNQLGLIEAFAQTKAAQQGWRLHLYGTGTPEWEHRLKACAKHNHIDHATDFMGLTETPYAVLQQAAICAYPSLTEGFGMALAEAMWCGCACIGFKTAAGVNELLTDNLTGRLVDPTPEAFAAAIDELAFDAHKRQALASTAAQTMQAAYAPDIIWQAWEDLLQQCVK